MAASFLKDYKNMIGGHTIEGRARKAQSDMIMDATWNRDV